MEGEKRRREDDLMADVNAHVHELAERLDPSGADNELWRFRCECADPDCHEQVWLTLTQYEESRRRRKPVLAPGHAPPPTPREP
jgi:hypothetical protein